MKGILKYSIAITLIIFVFKYFITDNQIILLKQVSFVDIIASIIFLLLLFAINGFQYSYLLFKYSKVKLSIADRFFFPIARNLWGYLVPVQGALAYSLAFCKIKYGVKLTIGFSINIYILLINLFFTGIIGIYYTISQNDIKSLLFFVSIMFILIPFFIYIFDFLFKFIPDFNINLIKTIKHTIQMIIRDNLLLWKDFKIIINIFLFNILHISVTVFWFYLIAYILNLNISLISIVLLAMTLKISLLFSFTPGNLGIEQIVSGGIFVLLNQNAADGILISLFNKMIAIFLAGTVGVYFTLNNLKYFNGKNFYAYIKNMRNTTL